MNIALFFGCLPRVSVLVLRQLDRSEEMRDVGALGFRLRHRDRLDQLIVNQEYTLVKEHALWAFDEQLAARLVVQLDLLLRDQRSVDALHRAVASAVQPLLRRESRGVPWNRRRAHDVGPSGLLQ